VRAEAHSIGAMEEPIVDSDWLARQGADGGARVVEVDVSPAAYEAGHIPGAVMWDAYADLRGGDYMPVDRASLKRLLERSGVAPETTLVFCGYGAALGFWLMSAYGHRDVRMLAGSREQWARRLGPLSADPPAPTPSSYPLGDAANELLVSREAVRAAIDDPRCVLLDVRSEAEYVGERFWPSGATEDAGRAGRIPGAVSVPIDLLRNVDDTYRPAQEMREVLARAGVPAQKRVIVYCTIGNRASQAWFALSRILDYADVGVYYASWVEWGKAPDAPIEL